MAEHPDPPHDHHCAECAPESDFPIPDPVAPRSIRDEFSSPAAALEHITSTIHSLRAVQARIDDAETVEPAEPEDHLRRALTRPGSPRVKELYRPSDLGQLVIALHQGVLGLVLNLPDPHDQALILSRLANSSSGGLMQHALDALDRARAEQGTCADPDRPDHAVIDPEAVAADIIAVEQRSTVGTSGKFLVQALTLRERMPRLWNKVTEGEIPKWVADIVNRETEHIEDPAIRRQIEVAILHRIGGKGGPSLWSGYHTRFLRKLVFELDPPALKDDPEQAERTRSVTAFEPHRGMVGIHAQLPPMDAEAVMAKIEAMAQRWARVPDEERSLDELRADALVQLVTGLDKRPPGDDEPLHGGIAQPRITVVADLDGHRGRERVWTGSTVATRERLDQLLEEAASAQIAVVPLREPDVTKPLGLYLDALSELLERLRRETTYAPSAELRRRIVERDGTCRHPGCTVAADRCDLDHVEPFVHGVPAAGGLTREDNIISLCRRHHRLKTHGNAAYRLEADGTVSVRIGESCAAESEPEGHRGQCRTACGMTYGTDAAGYRAELAALAELVAEISDLLDGVDHEIGVAAAGGAGPAAESGEPESTAAAKRAAATRRHRAYREDNPAEAPDGPSLGRAMFLEDPEF